MEHGAVELAEQEVVAASGDGTARAQRKVQGLLRLSAVIVERAQAPPRIPSAPVLAPCVSRAAASIQGIASRGGARAGPVFPCLLTRRAAMFRRRYVAAQTPPLRRWATRLRSSRRLVHHGRRPPVDAKVIEPSVTLKREDPSWGQRRIQDERRWDPALHSPRHRESHDQRRCARAP